MLTFGVFAANPFSRDPDAQHNILAYKIFTLLSFLLAFITSIVYTHSPPLDGSYTNGTIFVSYPFIQTCA